MLSVINRLNKNCEVKDITEIRIRQGQQITCCTNGIWAENLGDDEKKLLKNNLAGLIIQDNLNLGLEIIANKKEWVVESIRTPIKSLMKKKTFVKVAKIFCDLNIVMLEQILDIEGSYLLIW